MTRRNLFAAVVAAGVLAAVGCGPNKLNEESRVSVESLGDAARSFVGRQMPRLGVDGDDRGPDEPRRIAVFRKGGDPGRKAAGRERAGGVHGPGQVVGDDEDARSGDHAAAGSVAECAAMLRQRRGRPCGARTRSRPACSCDRRGPSRRFRPRELSHPRFPYPRWWRRWHRPPRCACRSRADPPEHSPTPDRGCR